MAADLIALCDDLDADESVGAVVVRGEGGSFCSGADQLKPPTIAAIQGAAVGAGVNLAAAADLRVVAESARIIAGFQRIGIHPGGGTA
jgi:enoyl-CoA hydratase